MKPTVPEKVKRPAVPRARKPDRPILRLIDRTTITIDLANCLRWVSRGVWGVAAIIMATHAPTVATAITKAAVHPR